MKRTKCAFALTMGCLFIGNVGAYERETHEYLSTIAADRSELPGGISGNILQDIGASPYSAAVYTRSDGASNQTIEQLIGYGANTEDDSINAFAHFFDPQYNNFEGTPLVIGEETFGFPILTAQNTSPDWAIEDAGERTISISVSGLPVYGPFHQDYSYLEAKRYYKLAMTGSSQSIRSNNMALMFESLGHVIHHVQDMA